MRKGDVGWLGWKTWRSSNVNQGGSLSNLRQVDVCECIMAFSSEIRLRCTL